MRRLPEHVRVPTGWNGPARSANGGVAAGVAAELIRGPVTVRLQAPVPMGVDLPVARDGDAVTVSDPGGEVLLRAHPAAPPAVEVPVVDHDRVGHGVPLADHAAATCVVCGPERDGDGLRLFPAPLPDRPGVVAAWWTPPPHAIDDTGHLDPRLLWGVLDCPGALAVMHGEGQPIFAALGEVTGEVLAPVAAGERVLVLGWRLGAEGRKRHAGTAVLADDGELRAHTAQVCIAVDPAWARGRP